MISLLVVSSIAALIAVKEWKKTEYLELDSAKVDSDSSNVVNDVIVDLKSLMKQIGDNEIVIPEDFNPDSWIDVQGQHKLRVLAEGKNVQFRLHLPNYIKRGVPKVRHYVTAMRSWRQNHGYMPDSDRVELQVTYVDSEQDTHVLIVPGTVTGEFSDERDKSGANRMYEALIIDKHENHNKALSALHGLIGQNEIKALEVVICYEYSGLNNNAIANILSTPIEVENEAGEIVKTENVLFSSDLESFYEMDDEKEEVVEYVFSFD